MDKIFSIKKYIKGFSANEIETNELNNQKGHYEGILREQGDRITELKEEVAKQKNKLEEYSSKEATIEHAILLATKKALEMDKDIKRQYALEIERLKLFQAKWTNAYEELDNKFHFGTEGSAMESLITSIKQDLVYRLEQDFSIGLRSCRSEAESQFTRESERLNSIANTKAEQLSNMIEKESAQFNMTEALQPKKSLGELCKALGL